MALWLWEDDLPDLSGSNFCFSAFFFFSLLPLPLSKHLFTVSSLSWIFRVDSSSCCLLRLHASHRCFFNPFFLFLHFYSFSSSHSNPRALVLPGHMFSPVICPWHASPCTCTRRAQTDWNINTYSQMYTCKNSWIRNTHIAKGQAEFFPLHTHTLTYTRAHSCTNTHNT